MKYLKFKAYFYNGFNEPELIATSITDLTKINITDNYLGDCSSELRDYIADYKRNHDFDDFVNNLTYLDIWINPTKAELMDANRSWFPSDSLETHLENFAA